MIEPNHITTTCSQPEAISSRDNAVEASLNKFVLGRMRNSAMQKWQQAAQRDPNPRRNDPKREEQKAEETEDVFYMSCPLCFEDRYKREVCTLSLCSHDFCRDCLTQWAQKTEYGAYPSCPLCRGPTTTQDMQSILGTSSSSISDQDDEMSYSTDDDTALTMIPDDSIPLTVSPRLGPSYPDLPPSVSLETRFSFMDWI